MGQKPKEMQENQKMSDKMAALSPHISIIILNVNRLNSPIKRHRVTRSINKQDPTICRLQETHLISNGKHRLRVKDGRRYSKLMANKGKQVLPYLDKVDFKIR